MPPIQLPLTLAQRHANQQLFSDHYLNVTLSQRAEWQLMAHAAAQALAAIASIIRAYVPSDNEAQIEEETTGRNGCLRAAPITSSALPQLCAWRPS
jgi:hypothetical protein